jgi:hypothetical protein
VRQCWPKLSGVLPLFAFRDTPVHGVVLRKGAQTTVSAAQISLDGLSELGTTTDNNGNFQLRVSAGRRQDDYTVRAQLGGEGGIASVKDADATKTSVRIELPPPADYGWTTVNVPEGWSLRAVLQKLADEDWATIVYGPGCTARHLNSKIRAGELRARTRALDSMYALEVISLNRLVGIRICYRSLIVSLLQSDVIPPPAG